MTTDSSASHYGKWNREIAARVSRSFHLTLRALPRGLREPVTLAYLLARTSDTVADTAGVAGEARASWLAEFAAAVDSGGMLAPGWGGEVVAQACGAERLLVARAPDLLEWLRKIDHEDRRDIATVVGRIVQGQIGDLEHFPPAGGVRALEAPDDLEQYTWLVAGCVGEFWTRICSRHVRRYARLPPERMEALGIAFGKGLQLVNILRDFPDDLAGGRCYLPRTDLLAAGLVPETVAADPEIARAVHRQWLSRARECLDAGWEYAGCVRPWRIRYACYLPLVLAYETLVLVAGRFPERGVKVPRATVRRLVRATAWRCLCPSWMEALRPRTL